MGHDEFHPDQIQRTDEKTGLVTALTVGAGDSDAQAFAPPHLRPIGGLIIEFAHLAGCAHEETFLVNWKQFAVLYGQLQAFRDTLPVGLADQFDAEAARFRNEWHKQVGSRINDL